MDNNLAVANIFSDSPQDRKEFCKMCGGCDDIIGYNCSGWPICRKCAEFHKIPLSSQKQ